MAIINVSRDVVLSSAFLNHPTTHGISVNGHWFHYVPVNANNNTLGASIVPYQWDTPLSLPNSASSIAMEGTIPLIEETWEGSTKKYHASTIEWIGAGVNDITGTLETDAFFFSHFGSLNPVTDDDVFYWDRLFLDVNSTEWNYYQYHKHLPLSYVQYENGRITTSANGYIVPSDKSFGYMIQTRAKVGQTTFSSVTARVHTPSIGGAHNSHNDVNLPSVAGFNYLSCGIVKGNSDRFHAMYIRANGSQWDVFIRTYLNTAKSFGVEANIGTFDLADPNFNPETNVQNNYPIRLSCGTTLGTRFYFPVITNNATSGFDLKIWSLNSTDNVAGGSLIQSTILTGQTVRPDCMLATVGDKLYALVTSPSTGGAKLFSYTVASNVWTDEGQVVTNSNTNFIRIHGFKYNPVDVRFYALLSGTTSNTGSYVGEGLYGFELTGSFSGYKHLDYVNSSNSFVVRNALSSGYVQYSHVDGTLKKFNTVEPQGIATGTSILQYDLSSPKFFNKNQYRLDGDSYYFQGIQLRDGRKMLVGQIENNKENLGELNSGDLFFTLVSDDSEDVHHFAWGGDGDDYITGIVEDTAGDKVWITGYTKSELVPKKDIKIHGWCRNISDGTNAIRWVDMTKDAEGNIVVAGNHVTENYMIAAKFDENYNLLWQKTIDGGANPDVAYSVSTDSSNNVYVVGSTENGTSGSSDAFLVKLSSSGSILYNRVLGNVSTNYASSVAIINKGGVEYIVISVVSGTSTNFLVLSLSGSFVEENVVSNLIVTRIRKHVSTSTSGRFLFAGNDGAGATKAAKFGLAEIAHPTAMIRWIETYSGGASPSQANDIANIDAADISGNNAGYVVVGTDNDQSLILKISVNETAETFTVTKSWAKNLASANGAFMSVAVSPHTATDKFIQAVGYTTMTMEMMTHDAPIVTRYTTSGDLVWQNTFGMGEHMNERFVSCMLDETQDNIITVGYSENHHTSGTDGLLVRLSSTGYGTGSYHLAENSSITYLYGQTAKATSANNNTLSTISAPSNAASSFAIAINNSLQGSDGVFTITNYDGSYGPNGVFTFFLASISLEAIQNYFNSEDHRMTMMDVSMNVIDKAYYTNNIFTFKQIGTVGDGTADDGNIFGYDIIQHSNGKIYCIGQTSGDVAKINTGASGVYDYILISYDPITEELEYYQNGSVLDEETYALCELSNGNIAFTGRTSGNLGGELIGNYDIFLGIYNPSNDTFSYYNTGSGLDDKGVNVHDLGNNELIVTYSTYGTINGTTNFGSEDIGAIKFNYSTNTWSTAYQAGSSTSELFNQNGSPSCVIGNRVFIVANSAGVFADDQQTFGYLDTVIGVLDLTTGTWKKYQVGSGASDFSTSVFPSGDKLLITGFTEASFVEKSNGFFVEFDVLPGVGAKSSTPEV
jgi:hypothetical protein